MSEIDLSKRWAYGSFAAHKIHCFNEKNISLCKRWSVPYLHLMIEDCQLNRCKTCSKKLAKLEGKNDSKT